MYLLGQNYIQVNDSQYLKSIIIIRIRATLQETKVTFSESTWVKKFKPEFNFDLQHTLLCKVLAFFFIKLTLSTENLNVPLEPYTMCHALITMDFQTTEHNIILSCLLACCSAQQHHTDNKKWKSLIQYKAGSNITWWPIVPNNKRILFFSYKLSILGTLIDFTASAHWALFNSYQTTPP